MSNVKTSISIPAELFKQVDRYAKKKRIPRSRIFVEGARLVLKNQTDQELTRRINESLRGIDQAEDRAFARAASASIAKILRDDRW